MKAENVIQTHSRKNKQYLLFFSLVFPYYYVCFNQAHYNVHKKNFCLRLVRVCEWVVLTRSMHLEALNIVLLVLDCVLLLLLCMYVTVTQTNVWNEWHWNEYSSWFVFFVVHFYEGNSDSYLKKCISKYVCINILVSMKLLLRIKLNRKSVCLFVWTWTDYYFGSIVFNRFLELEFKRFLFYFI